MPQRRDETKPKRDGGESGKKSRDSAWSNPKREKMGNQQPSREQRKVQRLSRNGVGASAPKWWTSGTDDDIVYAVRKRTEPA